MLSYLIQPHYPLCGVMVLSGLPDRLTNHTGDIWDENLPVNDVLGSYLITEVEPLQAPQELQILGPRKPLAIDPVSYSRWDELIRNGYQFFTGSWEFQSLRSSPKGERRVYHAAPFGHISRAPVITPGIEFTLYDGLDFEDFVEGPWTCADPFSTVGFYTLQDRIAEVNKLASTGEYSYLQPLASHGPGRFLLESITFTKIPNGVDLVFHLGFGGFGSGGFYPHYRVDRHQIRWNSLIESTSAREIFQFSYTRSSKLVHETIEYIPEMSEGELRSWVAGRPEDQGYPWQNVVDVGQEFVPFGIFCSPPEEEVLPYIGCDEQSAYFQPTPDSSLISFERVVRPRLRSFMMGNFHSSADALSNDLGDSSANLVELISELRSTVSPETYVDAFRAIFKRRGRTFEDFWDALYGLSNANLLYHFGISPTLGDAAKTAEGFGRIFERYSYLFKERTVHGSWVSQPFQLSEGFPDVHVEARSKIRLLPNTWALAYFLIPLNSFGILPNLHRVWATFPWTWAIDRVFDVGLAGKLIDQTLINALYDVDYSLHSLKVVCPLNSEFPDVTSISDSWGYNVYFRYLINGGLPLLSPTSIPTFQYGGLPRFDIVGSLVVQKTGK